MIDKPFVKSYLRIADKHSQRTEQMVKSTQHVLQQDELHDVADLVEVHFCHHHVDGVGGGKDEG